MGRSSLEEIDMLDILTKTSYIQLLERGYSVRDIFRAVSKGSRMSKKKIKQEFDFWRESNGISNIDS